MTTGAAATTTHAVPDGLARALRTRRDLEIRRGRLPRGAPALTARGGPPTLWPRRLPRPQSAIRRAVWDAPLTCSAPSVATKATLQVAPLSLLNIVGEFPSRLGLVAADWMPASIAADLPLPCGRARPSASLSCACFGDGGCVANQWATDAPSRWRPGAVTEVTLSVHVRSAIGRGDSRGIRMGWNPQHPTECRPAGGLEVWLSEVPAAVETLHHDQVTLVTSKTDSAAPKVHGGRPSATFQLKHLRAWLAQRQVSIAVNSGLPEWTRV